MGRRYIDESRRGGWLDHQSRREKASPAIDFAARGFLGIWHIYDTTLDMTMGVARWVGVIDMKQEGFKMKMRVDAF